MRIRFIAMAVACALALAKSASGAEGDLSVSYSGRVLSFSAADLAAIPHLDITCLNGHEKKVHAYTGIPVHLLLERAGAPFGDARLRGPLLGLAVVAHSRDSYAVAYALAEFDADFSQRTILLVDRIDGQPLSPGQGPYMLLAPGDKRPARWARMVVSLEVVPVTAPVTK